MSRPARRLSRATFLKAAISLPLAHSSLRSLVARPPVQPVSSICGLAEAGAAHAPLDGGPGALSCSPVDAFSQTFFDSPPASAAFKKHRDDVLLRIKTRWPALHVVVDGPYYNGTEYLALEALYLAHALYEAAGIADFANHTYPARQGEPYILINDQSRLLDGTQVYRTGTSYVARKGDSIQEVVYVSRIDDFAGYSTADLSRLRSYLVSRFIHEAAHLLQWSEIPVDRFMPYILNTSLVRSMSLLGYHVATPDQAKVGTLDPTQLHYVFDGDENPPDDYGWATNNLLVEEQPQIFVHHFMNSSFSSSRPKHHRYAREILPQVAARQHGELRKR